MRWRSAGGRVLVRVAAAILIVGAGAWIGAQTRAEGSAPPQPGSPQDPLVSESYVIQALGRTRAQILHLGAGEVWEPSLGTAWSLVSGEATLAQEAGGSLTTPGSSPAPVADLTAGSPLSLSSGSSGETVPVDHLLVTVGPGVEVTPGGGGAVLWVAASGSGRTLKGASLPANG